MRLWARRALAEGIGTFFLVFIGCGAIGSDALSGGSMGHVGISLAFGFVVTGMIYAIGHLSGAHINPAVTVGFWVAGRFPGREVLPYVAAQATGACVAAFALLAILGGSAVGGGAPTGGAGAGPPGASGEALAAMVGSGELAAPGGGSMVVGGAAAGSMDAAAAARRTAVTGVALGATQPSIGTVPALAVEFLLTFALVFVIMAVATDERVADGFAGLAVGLTVAFGALMGGPLTGGSMNPARSLGPALAGGTWDAHWLYWLAPLAGGAVAAVAYEFLRAAELPPEGRAEAMGVQGPLDPGPERPSGGRGRSVPPVAS